MTRFIAAIGAMLIAVGPAAIAAQDAQEMLNKPSVSDWNVYGAGQTHRLHKDAEVQGGGAMQIVVNARQEHVYDIGASVPVPGAIARGDRLIVAFWGKIVSGGTDGKTVIPVVSQTATSPFTPIIAGSVTLNDSWQLVSIKGVATADYKAGSTNVAIQLGGAAQKLELGPVFVIRLLK